MADFKTPNLAGASAAFNSFASKLESVKDNMLSGLEAEASALAGTLSTELTELTTTLRDMMPAVPTIPDVNLQSKLTSLAGFTPGSDQYNSLLSDVTSSFDSALTAGGYSLDSLVTSATDSVGLGETLSGVVPNFAIAADGLSGAIEKANAVLQATGDSVTEEASSIVVNPALKERLSELVQEV